jgi:hypothetical protein
MYIESIKFKRYQNSEYEEGYYIGDHENSDNSTILDKNYQPIENQNVWHYCPNAEKRIKLLIEKDIE